MVHYHETPRVKMCLFVGFFPDFLGSVLQRTASNKKKWILFTGNSAHSEIALNFCLGKFDLHFSTVLIVQIFDHGKSRMKKITGLGA